jgi:DNA-binding transcriptional LysR family regulator
MLSSSKYKLIKQKLKYALVVSKQTKSMDLSFLQSLVLVVDSGSLAQAARTQQLTSAALRKRITALEQELGVALIVRSGHTLMPTEACVDLLPRARHLLHEYAMLKEDVEPSGLSGQLKIGAISTALTGLMPDALRALAIHAPNLTPFLKPGTSIDLYNALLSEQLDVAVLVAPPFKAPKSIVTITLRSEPLVLITPRKLQASVKEALSTQFYIRYDATSWGGRYAQQYVLDQRLTPRLLCDLDGLEAITLMVAQDLGVSLIPAWEGLKDLKAKVHVTPILGVRYRRSIVLMARQPSTKSDKIKLLTALLKASRSAH